MEGLSEKWQLCYRKQGCRLSGGWRSTKEGEGVVGRVTSSEWLNAINDALIAEHNTNLLKFLCISSSTLFVYITIKEQRIAMDREGSTSAKTAS
jgi:hypothetical protein